MIRFSFTIDCSESKVIFKRRKKRTFQKEMLYREQTHAPRAFHSELHQQTNTVNTQKIPPWACDKGCAEACAERFSALNFERFPLLQRFSTECRKQFRVFFCLHVYVLWFHWRIARHFLNQWDVKPQTVLTQLCGLRDGTFVTSPSPSPARFNFSQPEHKRGLCGEEKDYFIF